MNSFNHRGVGDWLFGQVACLGQASNHRPARSGSEKIV
jgi:hypothetical protein